MLRIILPFLAAMPLAAGEPEIVAHRGASHDAPENTVAAIKLAWEQKADGSEFDVYLSKDGKIVVMHDKDGKRTTGVPKVIVETSAEELRTLDAGKWKDAKYTGEKVPFLHEMLETVQPGKRAFIEVKCGPEIVPELVKAIDAAKLKPEQTPVIAFNAAVIAEFKKAKPNVPAYWLASLTKPKNGKGKEPPTAEQVIAKAKEIKADGVDLQATEVLNEAYAKKVKAAGLKLYVWTVNDPAVAKRMVGLGVDGITTDRPAWLREQLAK